MHATAHGGLDRHRKNLHWKLILGEVKHPLLHGGLEPLSVLCLAFQSDALPSELFPPLLWVIWAFHACASKMEVGRLLCDQGSNLWPLDPESQVCCMARVWTCDLLILSLRFNNNNEYLERLTCTSPKRLHILYKYILSKLSAYNMNTHTHTRAHTHTHTHTHIHTHIHTHTHTLLVP